MHYQNQACSPIPFFLPNAIKHKILHQKAIPRSLKKCYLALSLKKINMSLISFMSYKKF